MPKTVTHKPSKTSKPGSGSKCLVPECVRKRERRGVCTACMASLRRQVASGKVSEEVLVTSGMLLESRRGPNGPAAIAVRALLARM